MKLLPSPSISSSSSTAISFDANVCTPKSSSGSYLSGIMRRLLCSGSLPTHPSDQVTDTTSMPCDNKQQEFAKSSFESSSTNPGIVARLMGLESFPDNNATSISRSRSLNSVEFRDVSYQIKRRHRRVKSTLSFDEIPTFLELENEQFLVLSFENRGDKKETKTKEMKSEEKRREKCKNKENRNVNVLLKKKDDEEIINKMVLRVLNEEQLTQRITEMPHQENVNFSKIEDSAESTLPSKELCRETNAAPALQDGTKFTRKKKIRNRCRLKNEEQEECSSEDLSPVSVLDFDQFIVDPEVPTSEEHSTSRRKLASRLEDYNHILHVENNLNVGDDLNSKRRDEPCRELGNKVCHIQYDLKMSGEICQLAEAQVIESIWTEKRVWNFKDFEDIIADFGLQILNELLYELVDQLA